MLLLMWSIHKYRNHASCYRHTICTRSQGKEESYQLYTRENLVSNPTDAQLIVSNRNDLQLKLLIKILLFKY